MSTFLIVCLHQFEALKFKLTVLSIKGQVSFEKRLRGGVIYIEELPKNSTGKVLKKKLKEMAL